MFVDSKFQKTIDLLLPLSPFVFLPTQWFIQKTNSSEVIVQPMHINRRGDWGGNKSTENVRDIGVTEASLIALLSFPHPYTRQQCYHDAMLSHRLPPNAVHTPMGLATRTLATGMNG